MAIINGTTANDTLNGTSDQDTLSGYDGNDQLYGNGGNDIIYGGNGDDVLGNGGGVRVDGVVVEDNDVYIGGAGNDTIEIYTSYGSDIIVFNKEDGHDTIRSHNNNTVLQLGEGFSKSDVKFVGYMNSFFITFMNSPGDSIFVDAEYGSSKYYLQTLKFHDGTTLDISPNNINNVIYREGGLVMTEFTEIFMYQD
jgi:Ca2+-binding RTX toxin-like protein